MQAALDAVALTLVDDRARHCVLEAAPDNRERTYAGLMTALGRLVGRR